MASPRAQRFCRAPSGAAPPTAAATTGVLWHGLCLGSAALGLLGVGLLRALRRRNRRPRGSCPPSDGRFAAARALRAAALASSCLGTAGILARSVLWLVAAPSETASPLCILILMWVQYWFVSHFWALFCYSLEAFLLLRNPTGHRCLALYYVLCWGASATQCLPGLQHLLSPARCSSHQALTRILEAVCYAAAYLPLTLVLLGSPLLFSRALRAVPALLRRSTGRYTAYERHQEQQLRRRFIGITTTFAACWMANVLNEVLLLLEQESSWRQEMRRWLGVGALICWTLMAILNPLSSFLLMLAFSAWRSRSVCVRRREPTWRGWSEGVGNGSQNRNLLPEATSGPAFGFLVSPGMLEVSSLLVSLDSSTSMDFIYTATENGYVPPLHQDVPGSQEEWRPGGGTCEGLLGWSCTG